MITLRVSSEGERVLLGKLAGSGPAVKERLLNALEFIGAELQARMIANAVGLNRKTGKLARSFYHRTRVRGDGDLFILSTGVARRAFYAAFQDQGVGPMEKDIRAYTTQTGRQVKAKANRRIYIRPHPFIESSFDQMQQEIEDVLRKAVAEGLENGTA